MATLCGIFIPRPGIRPALEAGSLNHWTTREVLACLLCMKLAVFSWSGVGTTGLFPVTKAIGHPSPSPACTHEQVCSNLWGPAYQSLLFIFCSEAHYLLLTFTYTRPLQRHFSVYQRFCQGLKIIPPPILLFLLFRLTSVAMAHYTLAWKIPWMEEAGRLQSVGLQRVGHDWATSLSLFTFRVCGEKT